MSVICKSSYIYSERKNNVYKCDSGGGDTINFYIPESLAVINTKSTYLVFNLKMTGTQYKACVSQKAGVYSLIRSMQISSGDGSTVFETLDHYAWLQALKYYYEQTETSRNLAVLHEGFPPSRISMTPVATNTWMPLSHLNHTTPLRLSPHSTYLDAFTVIKCGPTLPPVVYESRSN